MEVTLKTILQALNEHSQTINNRLDSLDQRVDNLEFKMNSRFDQLERKFDGKSVELSETQETLHGVATKTLQHEQKIKALQQQK